MESEAPDPADPLQLTVSVTDQHGKEHLRAGAVAVIVAWIDPAGEPQVANLGVPPMLVGSLLDLARAAYGTGPLMRAKAAEQNPKLVVAREGVLRAFNNGGNGTGTGNVR